ncbi:hypothetical protein N0V82_009949 [Gnomoniopsis sp. IMI 355080]|nr:hypothetical protein N0V82_009949 [Gnomoniopsis sp. IMI 355080]
MASGSRNISGPPATQPHGLLPSRVAVHERVQVTDDVGYKDSNSKELVSPPPQPAENLLVRLWTDIIALPRSQQEMMVLSQLQKMTSDVQPKDSSCVDYRSEKDQAAGGQSKEDNSTPHASE